jgi:hypothetical protein
MGYNISKNRASFKIKDEKLILVYKSITALAKTTCHLPYVDKTKLTISKNIDEAIKEFSWKFLYNTKQEPEINLAEVKVILSTIIQKSKDGLADKEKIERVLEKIVEKIPSDQDIIGIDFTGECAGAEKELFNAIAPYVEKDSWIEMSGEEGEVWRYVFDGEKCFEKSPKIEW